MIGRRGVIMAVRRFRTRRLRAARLRRIAIVSIIVLYAHVEMSFSPRAEDLEEHRVIDISLVTCGEFGRMPLPRALVLVGWVSGFYAGLENDTKVDVPVFVEKAERVISLCRQDESMRLMTLVEKLRHDQEPAEESPPPTPR
jgi:hypothetical protein